MADDIVTLALDGEISVADFAKAVAAFDGLVRALTDAVAPHSDMQWMIERLDTSSAVMTARAESADTDEVESVTQAFSVVGRSLSTSEPIPYPPLVEQHARSIASLIDGRIPDVRFETSRATHVVDTVPGIGLSVVREKTMTARGAVLGIVQTLSNRHGLRFTLYDIIFDKAVSCYLRENQEEMMRDVWGKRAIVEGTVTRDPDRGRPLAIRQITNVELSLEPVRESYRTARGIARTSPDAETPEDVIRRLRDAQ